jgi:CTP synthase (UTP-ammonia lyase)
MTSLLAIFMKYAIMIADYHEICKKSYRKGLKALREEGMIERSIIVCREERPLKKDGIEILPWRMFLELLWENRIVG